MESWIFIIIAVGCAETGFIASYIQMMKCWLKLIQICLTNPIPTYYRCHLCRWWRWWGLWGAWRESLPGVYVWQCRWFWWLRCWLSWWGKDFLISVFFFDRVTSGFLLFWSRYFHPLADVMQLKIVLLSISMCQMPVEDACRPLWKNYSQFVISVLVYR